MIDEVVPVMAADLKIYQFANESKTHFCNRILYSAISCWIKTSALDRPITSIDDGDIGVSRRHITDKCTTILRGMLQRLPSSQPWFQTDADSEPPVALLRARLLRHGDLLNAGFNTDLILAPLTTVTLSSELKCANGYLLDPNFFYSGISMLQTGETVFPEKDGPEPDSTTWLKKYIKSAWWKHVDTLDGNIEYFNAYKMSRNNHTCWQTKRPDAVNGILLIRRVVNLYSYEYLLVKLDYDLQIHRIDPLLQEICEHRRFMFALRSMAQNMPSVNTTVYSDHVNLQIRVFMPERENRLLESFAWPHNIITDKLEWDMPLPVWCYIKPHLERLGIAISEVFYG